LLARTAPTLEESLQASVQLGRKGEVWPTSKPKEKPGVVGVVRIRWWW
jgi:hypothetical protein